MKWSQGPPKPPPVRPGAALALVCLRRNSASDVGNAEDRDTVSQLSPLGLSPHLGVIWGNILKPRALSLAAPPPLRCRTNLSSLFHDGGVGCGVALGGADEPTGAQEAQAGGRDIPRRDLVLAWVPSAHAAAHRAGRREGVGLPKAATVGANREEPGGMSPLQPSHPPGCLWDASWGEGVCSHFDSHKAYGVLEGLNQERAMIKRTAGS